MKPVLILQNLSSDGPAYLARWLSARGVAFEVVDFEAGQAAPPTLDGHGALALLGGEMSANDDLPSLRQTEHLFREAIARGVPTVGHCLGGQLMARALGARVRRATEPEIGWQRLRVSNEPEAAAWLGAAGEREVFQWHFDTFDLPPGAVLLAGSEACPNQAFSLGPHLAMQFHVEVDREKLVRWARENSNSHGQALASHPGSVQTAEQMQEAAVAALDAQAAMADRIYRRWLTLRPP